MESTRADRSGCGCGRNLPVTAARVTRRSLCVDRAALDARKENKPKGNIAEMAAAIGIELLTEARYRELQTLGEFDRKASSWVRTPAAIRALSGALFCDRRYDQVFVYHNGAESYYAARGFRGRLVVWRKVRPRLSPCVSVHEVARTPSHVRVIRA